MLVKPFLKFPGGKGYLADTIIGHFPKKFGHYWEPMVGAGAVFFEMASRGMIKEATISDINNWLMSAYQNIHDDPHKVIMELRLLREVHVRKVEKYGSAKKFYYRVRKHANTQSPPGAAFTIYLSKTCFNGLFRFNQKGHFNAPFGDQKNPSLFDPKNISNIHTLLSKHTNFGLPEYVHNFKHMKKKDLVYLDPPYWPVTESSFTSYNKFGFSKDDHVKLAHLVRKLQNKGVYVVISNSDTPAVRKLYKGFNIVPVQAPRRINRNGKGRGNVTELLIKSF